MALLAQPCCAQLREHAAVHAALPRRGNSVAKASVACWPIRCTLSAADIGIWVSDAFLWCRVMAMGHGSMVVIGGGCSAQQLVSCQGANNPSERQNMSHRRSTQTGAAQEGKTTSTQPKRPPKNETPPETLQSSSCSSQTASQQRKQASKETGRRETKEPPR
jgi:hypothetical protein